MENGIRWIIRTYPNEPLRNLQIQNSYTEQTTKPNHRCKGRLPPCPAEWFKASRQNILFAIHFDWSWRRAQWGYEDIFCSWIRFVSSRVLMMVGTRLASLPVQMVGNKKDREKMERQTLMTYVPLFQYPKLCLL